MPNQTMLTTRDMIPLKALVPYADAALMPSPNSDLRQAAGIEGIVLHATADRGDEGAALAWLRSPKSRVSCHLLVSRTGDVTRLVGDQLRAWHAGAAWWRGSSDVNSITLGIELANRNDGEAYTDAQDTRVAEIVAHYCRQGLPLDDVVGHHAIAKDRSTDPVGWDWTRFRAMVQMLLQSGITKVPSSTPKQVLPIIVKPKPKSAARSRTIWLNVCTVLVTGVVLISEALDLAFSIGLTLPREIALWALFVIGVVNIILRYHTTCAIGAPDVPKPSLPSIPSTPRAPLRLR